MQEMELEGIEPVSEVSQTLGTAEDAAGPGDHPGDHIVNLRVGVPAPSGRYYLNVLIGREKRDGERLTEERAHHPVGTVRNRIFLFVATAVFGLGGLLLVFDGALFLLELLGMRAP